MGAIWLCSGAQAEQKQPSEKRKLAIAAPGSVAYEEGKTYAAGSRVRLNESGNEMTVDTAGPNGDQLELKLKVYGDPQALSFVLGGGAPAIQLESAGKLMNPQEADFTTELVSKPTLASYSRFRTDDGGLLVLGAMSYALSIRFKASDGSFAKPLVLKLRGLTVGRVKYSLDFKLPSLVVGANKLNVGQYAGNKSRLNQVSPSTAKVGDVLTATGDSLLDVKKVYLEVGKTAKEAEMIEQTASRLRFRVPQVDPGTYSLMIRVEGESVLYGQDPRITVE